MNSVTVTQLCQGADLSSNGYSKAFDIVTLKSSFNANDGLVPIRLNKEMEAMDLGKHIEELLLQELEGKNNSGLVSLPYHELVLKQQLQQYCNIFKICSKVLKVKTQVHYQSVIDGILVKGVCDAMLNDVNIMEVKHTSTVVGLDQLMHYAALRFLSSGKETWYLTLCNTNLAQVYLYQVSKNFYHNGAALDYLRNSLAWWREMTSTVSSLSLTSNVMPNSTLVMSSPATKDHTIDGHLDNRKDQKDQIPEQDRLLGVKFIEDAKLEAARIIAAAKLEAMQLHHGKINHEIPIRDPLVVDNDDSDGLVELELVPPPRQEVWESWNPASERIIIVEPHQNSSAPITLEDFIVRFCCCIETD